MKTLDEVLALCRESGRICPIGQKWKQFHDLLQQLRPTADPPLPRPFLGADWWKTPDTRKAKRLEEQLQWCDRNGLLDDAHRFLASLRGADWHPQATNTRMDPSPKARGDIAQSGSTFNELAFVREEIRKIPGISRRPRGGIGSFRARVGDALSLALKEKEIVAFGLLQWAAIGFGYLLWVQMLDWIPEDVWRSAAESRKGSIVDLVLLAWSFVCVGLVAFPVGILSGCMGATHFLHRQGKESSVAACLGMVLPRSWSLWSFHWIDGWITVTQILERLPKRNDRRTPEQRAASEALYYAWKLGVAGVLPGILSGKNLLGAGQESIRFVKARFVDVAKLRAGYSSLCWIVGILAYLGTMLLFMVVEIVPPGSDAYGHIHEIYLWAGGPILVALSVVMLVLRPIYILSICDLYVDHLQQEGVAVDVPDSPPPVASALVAFGVLCIVVACVYVYRDELGISALLAVPYGQGHAP